MEVVRLYVRSYVITRIALRYINRIEISDQDELGDYMRTSVVIAKGIPQTLDNLLVRIVIPKQEMGVSANITITTEDSQETEKFSIIFDIDTFKVVKYGARSRKTWPDFEDLRDYKNDIFFYSITERCRELFR